MGTKQSTNKVSYNYRAYDSEKFGLFKVISDVYGKNGWITELENHKVIGETDDVYVTSLISTGWGEWVDGKVVQKKHVLPVGIHKSRFDSWVAGQLELF